MRKQDGTKKKRLKCLWFLRGGLNKQGKTKTLKQANLHYHQRSLTLINRSCSSAPLHYYY